MSDLREVQRPRFWGTISDEHAPAGMEDTLRSSGQCEPPSGTQMGCGELDPMPTAALPSPPPPPCSRSVTKGPFCRQSPQPPEPPPDPCIQPGKTHFPNLLEIHPGADHLKPPERSQRVRDAQPPSQASNGPLGAEATSGNLGSPQSPQCPGLKAKPWGLNGSPVFFRGMGGHQVTCGCIPSCD